MKGKRMSWLLAVLGTIGLGGLLTGCSGNKGEVGKEGVGENSVKQPAVSTEPVTIRLGAGGGAAYPDDIFQQTVADPVKKKYPNITVELIKNQKGALDHDIANWLASNTTPDIIAESNGRLPNLFTYGLLMDMTPLMKETGVDINRFDPLLVDPVRKTSDKGWMVAIPYGQNWSALYYNKNIFDKFGVPYPQDRMTWDETIDLARRLARFENGVQYVGLMPGSTIRIAESLSLTAVDPKTNKASVNNEQWKRVFELDKRILADIPGAMNNGKLIGQGDFWSKQNVAMMANVNRVSSAPEGFTDWDFAQYPSLPELPGRSGMVGFWVMAISSTSQHKLEAMQVINVVTSDEAQLIGARTANMSALTNPEMVKQFGADLPVLKGKHIENIFKSKPAPAPQFSLYNYQANTLLYTEIDNYLNGKKDINTALRDADEQINKMLAEQK